MGREYGGDIEGKFWFAVQDSNASEQFGGFCVEPSHFDCGFEEWDLPDVERRLEEILSELKSQKDGIAALNEYEECGYVESSHEDNLIKLVADLELGRKIRDCIKENGHCFFIAEY